MSWVTGRHHVLSIKHLLDELGHCESTVLLAATGCERSEAGHEEMQARERDHVDGQFAQVGVQLSITHTQAPVISTRRTHKQRVHTDTYTHLTTYLIVHSPLFTVHLAYCIPRYRLTGEILSGRLVRVRAPCTVLLVHLTGACHGLIWLPRSAVTLKTTEMPPPLVKLLSHGWQSPILWPLK